MPTLRAAAGPRFRSSLIISTCKGAPSHNDVNELHHYETESSYHAFPLSSTQDRTAYVSISCEDLIAEPPSKGELPTTWLIYLEAQNAACKKFAPREKFVGISLVGEAGVLYIDSWRKASCLRAVYRTSIFHKVKWE